MIDGIDKAIEPNWLSNIEKRFFSKFPLLDIIENSLYYPACGLDGSPIKYMGGNILSFIYVDYGVTKEKNMADLNNKGCAGYDILLQREIDERDLVPHGWKQKYCKPSDGDPSSIKDFIVNEPYCLWTIFKRQPNRNQNHGPDKFSLLYLTADGAAAFDAIYLKNNKRPKAIAIIQPGTAFGGNWTDFRDHTKILGRYVLNNPAGIPDYLLYGGWGSGHCYKEPCWPPYNKYILFYPHEPGSVGIWEIA
jgi:hypothetical protein